MIDSGAMGSQSCLPTRNRVTTYEGWLALAALLEWKLQVHGWGQPRGQEVGDSMTLPDQSSRRSMSTPRRGYGSLLQAPPRLWSH